MKRLFRDLLDGHCMLSMCSGVAHDSGPSRRFGRESFQNPTESTPIGPTRDVSSSVNTIVGG